MSRGDLLHTLIMVKANDGTINDLKFLMENAIKGFEKFETYPDKMKKDAIKKDEYMKELSSIYLR